MDISIHVPREGNDRNLNAIRNCIFKFQSTFPARGTTSNNKTYEIDVSISIHVPREGNDSKNKQIKF